MKTSCCSGHYNTRPTISYKDGGGGGEGRGGGRQGESEEWGERDPCTPSTVSGKFNY